MTGMNLAELVKIVHLQAIAAREATVCITAALAETGSPELRVSLHRHFLRSAATLDQASPVIGEHLRELADLVEILGSPPGGQPDAFMAPAELSTQPH
ncbi:hypothetical protein [Geminicoccus flavidas]|uniref:hypothetical protein n=1 Tax=Geminicoccus flavidas TaxID=2506407 RepID=UPI00135A93FE|nr:hypothetical protein [Geminicoccus flavidas]